MFIKVYFSYVSSYKERTDPIETAKTEQITTIEFLDIFKQYGKQDYSYKGRKLWVNDIGFGFYNKNFHYDYTDDEIK